MWHHFYEAFAGFRISETKKRTNDKEKEDKLTLRNNKDYFREPAGNVAIKNELEGRNRKEETYEKKQKGNMKGELGKLAEL